MTKGTTLLVIGRNNQNKNSRGITSMLERLKVSGVSVQYYESKTAATSALLEDALLKLIPGIWLARKNDFFLGKLVLKIIKATLLLRYPSRWRYYLFRNLERHHTSTRELVRFIRKQEGKSITLLTHSAGGIAGTLVEHLENVNGHICFGYPFKHPDKPEESRRTSHLGCVKKPFLIVQGNQDEYGNSQSTSCYKLSPTTTLRPIEATHDYEDMNPAEFEALFVELQRFLAKLG
jgi:hypothetical protein